MIIDRAYGNYLGAPDLAGQEITLEVASVTREEMENTVTKKIEKKVIVAFKGAEKRWVLNRTNAMCIKAMLGPDTDKWIGQKITLYVGAVESGPERGKPAVRVRGAPSLTANIEFELVLPNKKPFKVILFKTQTASTKEVK